jgi:hypothetical protein
MCSVFCLPISQTILSEASHLSALKYYLTRILHTSRGCCSRRIQNDLCLMELRVGLRTAALLSAYCVSVYCPADSLSTLLCLHVCFSFYLTGLKSSGLSKYAHPSKLSIGPLFPIILH